MSLDDMTTLPGRKDKDSEVYFLDKNATLYTCEDARLTFKLFIKSDYYLPAHTHFCTNQSYARELEVYDLTKIDFLKMSLFYHVAPLGSIPELPAESCSEIKASEGTEMVNGDYWIYSDGNGQTILARCEGIWPYNW